MTPTNCIKKLRFERGITQEQLANEVGVRRETIVFLEQSRYMPSLHLAYQIAKYFGKSIEEVFSF